MQEEWKDVAGHKGLYQVSNLGRVKSLSRMIISKRWGTPMYRLFKEIIRKPSKTRNGYYMLALCKNNINRNYSISRLVAIAFIPNPKNKMTVNHIDGNKTNNIAENLEWATHSENMKHAFRTGLLKVKIGKENPLHGRHFSEEHKRKIGESKKGKHLSEETKNKISIALTGKKLTEECKINMSKAQKGRCHSLETRMKISKAIKLFRSKERTIANNRGVMLDE